MLFEGQNILRVQAEAFRPYEEQASPKNNNSGGVIIQAISSTPVSLPWLLMIRAIHREVY